MWRGVLLTLGLSGVGQVGTAVMTTGWSSDAESGAGDFWCIC